MGWKNKPASNTAEVASRPRPAMLRALGDDDPPETVAVGAKTYHRCEIFKHDSWAATALYRSDRNPTDPTQSDHLPDHVVCKFQRQSPLLGLPMQWFGRWLAQRETANLRRMHDEPRVPDAIAGVSINGQPCTHIVAHEFVQGEPLRRGMQIDPSFFAELDELLANMHARRLTYIDLNKRENIIVGSDGRPHLIDFQISLRVPDHWCFGPLLNVLQSCDRYHLSKHRARFHPGWSRQHQQALRAQRPYWIRLHRCIAVPFRGLRRAFLVICGIRKGRGFAHSETFVEEGLRPDPSLAVKRLEVPSDLDDSGTTRKSA